MKFWRNPKVTAWLSLAVVQAVCLGFADEPAPATTTNAPATEIRIPKSEFDDSLPNGKNPFFPRSQRQTATKVSTNASRVAPSILVLRGVSGSPERYIAVINNWSFSAGEEKEVVITGSRIKIRCEEIRADMAVVSVGTPPQRVELHLHKKF